MPAHRLARLALATALIAFVTPGAALAVPLGAPPPVPLPGRASVAPHPLTLAARIWGLAKYRHPQVTGCAVDWDRVLLDRVAALEAADDTAQREEIIGDLLAAAGGTPQGPVDAQTPAWIVDADLGSPLTGQLAWLAAQTAGQQCYVTATPGTGQAAFATDAGHPTATPDRAHRALAAFRYWNAIEYFFPYKADIGRPWHEVLDATLADVLDAETTYDYVIAIRALTAGIEDSHAFLAHPPIDTAPGSGLPPFSLQTLEGRTVVSLTLPQASDVEPGDELIEVDGISLHDERTALDPLMHGSNPVFREMITLRSVLSGAPDPGQFRFRREDGSEYLRSLPRGGAIPGTLEGQPTWQRRALDGCSMGLIDLARLQPADVEPMLAQLADTDALVFDVRNYPNGTLWPLAARLFDQPQAVAAFTRPRLDRPGEFESSTSPIGGTSPSGYDGRILVLQDERSISQSEYTIMGLQSIGRTLVFGSQTAAADGNITRIDLPGNIVATFTGLGVYYPDGRPTQRLGIVPDVHVRPTRAGLRAGRDEVLEAALDCRWLQDTPARRLPRSGLYFAEARDGEGIDVHHDGVTAAVISYGFDDAGDSEWLLSAGTTDGDGWRQQFRAFADDGDRSDPADGYELDAHAGTYSPACARVDQNDISNRVLWRWPSAGAGRHAICTDALLQSGGPASGLWTGPDDELGWGISVHDDGAMIAVVVYAYDAGGQPRWVIGNAAWTDDGSVVDVPLQRVAGFCRHCAPTALVHQPAGTLRLDLGTLRGDDSGDWLDIDAEFADGSRWQRQRMPLSRLLASSQPTSSRVR